MDIQKLVDAISESGMRERASYHATFGDLIDKLKTADDSSRLFPAIKGLGAYRGYYSDIALCTESGNSAFKSAFNYYGSSVGNWGDWYKENYVNIELPEKPKEIAILLESLLGKYFEGYKGDYFEITRDKPLWLATDHGECSDLAVVEITDDLRLITKQID